MIIGKITDYIIRSLQSTHTAGTKFKVNNLEDLCNQGRAVQIRSVYTKTGRVNPIWLQTYIPEYEAEIQDDVCSVKFQVPASVMLNNETDGFIYIGTPNKNCAYRKLPNRAQLALYKAHKNSGNKTVCIWEDGILEVYGPQGEIPKVVRIDAVFENPFILPDYNLEYSDYPLDNDNLAQMQQLLISSLLNQGKTPTNYKPTNTDPITTQP
jgi:hypothetical protein